MLNAKFYHGANDVQRRDARIVLDEYSEILKWRRNDGEVSLIDIGTGSGDVLMDFIYPKMPKNFRKIIGSDISPEMIRHCRKTYSQVKNVEFMIFDMGSEVLPKEVVNEFDRVTSFYCINFAIDLRHVIKNVYEMLRNDGDCFLVFLANHLFFDGYKRVSLNPKWTPYMTDVDQVIPYFQHTEKPKAEFEEILSGAGFSNYCVEVKEDRFVYRGLDTMRKNVTAVSPFYERIPPEMRGEFIDEIIKSTVELNPSESSFEDGIFSNPYKLLVAYARK